MGELRCTCRELGALLEIAPGLMRMLRLCADNWATQNKVKCFECCYIQYNRIKFREENTICHVNPIAVHITR